MNEQHSTNDSSSDFTEAILARIRGGEVRMRPRAYFVIQTVALLTLAALVVALTAFLVNYMLFAFMVEGHQSLLMFGARGIETLALVFPWEWLFVDIVLIVITTYLVRRFRFGYRRSVLYVAGGLFLLALIAGVALEGGTPLNRLLLDGADHDALPQPLSSLYEGVHGGAPHNLGVFRGIVNAVGTSTFTMMHDDFDHDSDDGDIVVVPPPEFDTSELSPGDHVYVAGTPTSAGIAAYGVDIISAPPGEDMK